MDRRRTGPEAEAAKRCGTRPGQYWTPENGGWTKAELKLLGTDTDEAIARRIGRTVGAVRVRRAKLGLLTFEDRRRK